tara:strand:- start:1549 stop:1755 length:207 start_codon:yes stop_codon:yes gene_type:complete
MNYHQRAYADYETSKAAEVLAKLVVNKARKEFKQDPKNDKKRFRLQDAIGRSNRASKIVWCKQDFLPK